MAYQADLLPLTKTLKMSFYWVKTHRFIKWLFPQFVWDVPCRDKSVYLTFDDGPIPEATPMVLNLLQRFNAKATFFCIGDNIGKHPEIFRRIIDEGHTVGNHTQNHLNGWKTPLDTYLKNVAACQTGIEKYTRPKRKLMRPPYGKITRAQSRALRHQGYEIVMWDVLSADYDTSITPEKCFNNAASCRPGSIVIFHDSVKALPNMGFALERLLKKLSAEGYDFKAL